MKPNRNKGEVVNKFKTCDSSSILLLLTTNVRVFFWKGGGALRVVEV